MICDCVACKATRNLVPSVWLPCQANIRSLGLDTDHKQSEDVQITRYILFRRSHEEVLVVSGSSALSPPFNP
jgi:hypothetical protein